MAVTVDTFREAVLQRPLHEIVDELVFKGEPFVFRETPTDYDTLRGDLVQSLRLTPAAMTIVGSAKVGFSMHPDQFGKPFHDDSDVDVVVIDPDRFDRLWQCLVRWDFRLAQQEGFRKQWRRKRRAEIYWGWFFDEPLYTRGLDIASALGAVRDISNEWFNAFQSVGLRHAKLAGRKFNGRLYRTWDHARNYHVNGLRLFRDSLLNTTRGGP